MLSSVASSAVYCLGPMRSRLSLGTPRRFSARYQGAANVMCIRITWTSSWIGAGSRWSGWCWRSRRSGPLRQPGTKAGAWSPKRLGELRGWPVATIPTRPLRPPTQRANQGPHVLRCSTRVDGHMQPPRDPTAFWLTSGGNSPRFGKATRCGGRPACNCIGKQMERMSMRGLVLFTRDASSKCKDDHGRPHVVTARSPGSAGVLLSV